jgi:hypothetical protein
MDAWNLDFNSTRNNYNHSFNQINDQLSPKSAFCKNIHTNEKESNSLHFMAKILHI